MSLSSFWNSAAAAPQQVILVEPDGTEHLAGALLGECNRVAHGLRALGLGPGDTVATVLPNGAPMVEVALAAAQVGMYVTPVNIHLTAPEVEFVLRDCGAKAVVCGADYARMCGTALLQGGPTHHARFVVGPDPVGDFRPYSSLKQGQPTTPPEERTGGYVMTYTSGTTGRPRGVRRPTFDIPADVLADNFTRFLQLFGIPQGGTHLVVSPLYHTAVVNFCMYSLHHGHAVVLMDKWTPEGFLERVERYRVTTSHMVPTHFVRLLALPEATRWNADVSSLTHAIHSAAPCPVEVKRQMLDWWGDVIFEYYAASEGGGTLATPQDWRGHPGTVGKAWPMSQIRVLNDEGEEVATGAVGTVWMRMGEYRFEYHGDEEKTRKAWSEGFFTVGDAGYLDGDGFLYLCDRKADMIISGGVNIYPAEVESSLILHPAVMDCAVFGIPDEQWGEQVKAVVQLVPEVVASAETAARILEFLRERVAAYKCPRSLDFIDEMPRDPNGKLYKRRLRDPYWEGRSRAI